MSSFLRNLQRKRLRNRSDYEPRPQVTVINADGGYKTLRPTRGWLEMSLARVTAQMLMAKLLDHYVVREPKAKVSKTYRKPATVPQSSETRQQRRAYVRGYVGAVMHQQPKKRSRSKKAAAA